MPVITIAARMARAVPMAIVVAVIGARSARSTALGRWTVAWESPRDGPPAGRRSPARFVAVDLAPELLHGAVYWNTPEGPESRHANVIWITLPLLHRAPLESAG